MSSAERRYRTMMRKAGVLRRLWKLERAIFDMVEQPMSILAICKALHTVDVRVLWLAHASPRLVYVHGEGVARTA